MKYHITPEEKGTRLDKFLVEKMPHLTRTQIQKAVKGGQVLVNDKKPTPHHFLKGGDIVDTEEMKIDTTSSDSQKISSTGKTKTKTKFVFPKSLEPKIIFEDENFLVINKPSGILVHARDE